MRTETKSVLAVVLFAALSPTSLFGQRGKGRAGGNWGQMLLQPSFNTGWWDRPWGDSFYFPSYGGFGSYITPFFVPTPASPYPYMPNYWWAGAYATADPRQEGYNVSSGYPAGSVAILLLTTTPGKARITLDGIFVGNSDSLGPIQMPVGEHSLRAEAPGYEPAETVLKIEQPVLQQMEIRLSPVQAKPKPGPQG